MPIPFMQWIGKQYHRDANELHSLISRINLSEHPKMVCRAAAFGGTSAPLIIS